MSLEFLANHVVPEGSCCDWIHSTVIQQRPLLFAFDSYGSFTHLEIDFDSLPTSSFPTFFSGNQEPAIIFKEMYWWSLAVTYPIPPTADIKNSKANITSWPLQSGCRNTTDIRFRQSALLWPFSSSTRVWLKRSYLGAPKLTSHATRNHLSLFWISPSKCRAFLEKQASRCK